MGAFDFRSPKSSGTYTDLNGVRWSIHADPSEMLRGEWTADTDVKSRYGVTTIWGPARTLRERIDAYAAGYAVVPPASSGDSSWVWLVVAAVVVLSDGRRR
jgi:hypothetical protein